MFCMYLMTFYWTCFEKILPVFSENVSLHQLAHERLGELLRVLKLVISKHQSLNSVDILSATGTVISKVKGKTGHLTALY